MENQNQENTIKGGAYRQNPTRYNNQNRGGDEDNNQESETNFDSENNELEINPGKDREEIDLDKTGPDNSPKQMAQAQKNNQQGGDRGLEETTPTADKKLLGQTHAGKTGFATSGTSGTNSGGKQGYQSGLGSAGSQNGSTGYNAGSQGLPPEAPKK